MNQPGKVANPARGQLNRGNEYFLCPRSRLENLVTRDGLGSPLPASACSFSILKLNVVLTHGISPEFRGGVHFLISTAIRHRVSPEFIGSRNSVPMGFTAESLPALGQ